MAAWHVYMLECRNGTLYTGVTTDVERRFREHQRRPARYTAYNPPVRIVHAESFSRKADAFRREAEIKGWTRAKKLALVSGGHACVKRRSAW